MEFSGGAPPGPSSDKPSESQIMGQLQGDVHICAFRPHSGVMACLQGKNVGHRCRDAESQLHGAGELQLAAIQEFMTVKAAISALLCLQQSDLCFHALHIGAMQTVRDKCFHACVTKPSSSLSSSEQTCLSRCSDRYECCHWWMCQLP